MRGWRRLVPSQTAAVAAVAVLCAVATIGLKSRAAFPLSVGVAGPRLTGPALDDVLGVMAGAGDVALIALLILALHRRRMRKQADGDSVDAELPRSSLWSKLAILLYPLAVFAIPILLLSRNLRHRLVPLQLPGFGRTAGRAAQQAGRVAANGSSWPVLTGIVVAIAVVTAIVLLERRHGVYRRPTRLRRPALRSIPLRTALSAGAAALREGTDPRAAIIACYAAMERALAGAGAAPTAADTPAEVLDRAVAGGLIHSPAADDLTGLFRRARYGGGDIGETERAAARGALARLESDLGGPS